MNRLLKILLPFALVLALFAPIVPQVRAQDQAAPVEDAGFLERQIQNALGGAGRTVRVSGLQGVLSSQASIGLIEISDADGVWLRARDVVLDWRRLALLRGRLEVDALTVGTVNVIRRPLPATVDIPALSADEQAIPTGPFSLPSLPVAVNVAQFAIGGLRLGKPVLGQAATLSVSGSAGLAGGEGNANLSVVRIDGKSGSYALSGAFDNATRQLRVNVNVAEDQGGLVSTLSSMPGAPAMTLTVTGDAPLRDFAAELHLTTDNVERLTGSVTLKDEPATQPDTASAQLISVDVSGDVANLFLPEYQSFFGRNVSVVARARRHPDSGLEIPQLDIVTNGMTLDGQMSLSPGYVPNKVDLTARFGIAGGLPVVLPLPGPAVLLQRGSLTATYDEASGDNFNLSLLADGIQRTDGILVDHADVVATGTLIKSAPGSLASVAATVTSAITGFSHTDRGIAEAVGDDFTFSALADWAKDGPLKISDLKAIAGDLSLTGNADVTGLQNADIAVNATLAARAEDLSRFSTISGQSVTGAITADLGAQYDLTSGAFDVTLGGRTYNLAIGEDSANDLLAGAIDLDLRAARTADGIDLSKLSLKGPAIDLTGTASITPKGWPRKVAVTGHVGSLVAPPVVLPVPGVEMQLQRADVDLNFDAAKQDGFTALIAAQGFSRDGITVETARIDARGELRRGVDPDQVVGLTATLASDVSGFVYPDPAVQDAVGSQFTLTSDIGWANGAPLKVTNLKAAAGDVALNGDATIDGLQGDAISVNANITAEAGDLNRFSALSGQPLAGTVSADLTADYAPHTGYFTVDLTGQTQDLAVGDHGANALLQGKLDLAVKAKRDDAGTALNTLTLRGQAIDLAGTANLSPEGWPSKVDISGQVGMPSGAPVILPIAGPEASLQQAVLDLAYDAAQDDRLHALIEATGFLRDGLVIGKTRLDVEGSLQRDPDSSPPISALVAKITGQIAQASAKDPALDRAVRSGADLNADLNWNVANGLLDLKNLSFVAGDARLTGDVQITDPGAETRAFSSTFDLNSGPLSRFAALAGRPLGGSVTANGTASYAMSTGYFGVDLSAKSRDLKIGQEQVDLLIRGDTTIVAKLRQDVSGLDIQQLTLNGREIDLKATGGRRDGLTTIIADGRLRDVGLVAPGFSGPIVLAVTAKQRGLTWSINGNAEGPGGARIAAVGDVLRPDGQMALKTTGSLPLGLVNGILAPRLVQGNVDFAIAVNGTPGLGALSGTITLGSARFSDPGLRLALENIRGRIAIENSRANLDVKANVSSGGTIALAGPITLTGDLPADLTTTLTGVRLENPSLYQVDLGGKVTVNGPLADGAKIGGRIDITRAEIKISGTFGGGGAIPDIVHVDEPAASLQTRKWAGLVNQERAGRSTGRGPVYPLGLVISAPNQIFIRGRGLDAELGGQVEITGTTANPIPTGEFSLIRGRMSILQQNLVFEDATISMQGDLVPDINMVAVSGNNNTSAMITIAGPITAPEIKLSSEPQLPDDEILAQLFFSKSVSELSAIELAQLAGAINELAGGDGGILARLRSSTGLDDLNVTKDSDGNTAVSAGRYLSKKVYTDVTVDSTGTSRVELKYEIRRDLSAGVGFDSQGNTGFGLSFGMDY